MENDDYVESDHRKLVIFGRDVSQIPCFRNSWLYGISGGMGSGLLYFMCTSKVRMATHVGFTSMMVITGSYWIFCRYQYAKQVEELKVVQEYLERRVLIKGTEMEKLYESGVPKEEVADC